MPPLAICSSATCDFVLELQDLQRGKAIPRPEICPKCDAAIIDLCPQCRFLIMGAGGELQQKCKLCRADFRQVFAERLKRIGASGCLSAPLAGRYFLGS
jgi:hypothetical protein